MDYKIDEYTHLKNAKIEVQGVEILYEAGEAVKAIVSFCISDDNDGVSMPIESTDIPNSTNPNAVETWIKNKLKDKEA